MALTLFKQPANLSCNVTKRPAPDLYAGKWVECPMPGLGISALNLLPVWYTWQSAQEKFNWPTLVK